MKKVFIFLVTVAFVGLIGYGYILTSAPSAKYEAPQAQAHVDEYENGVESVMSREEFKKQQALLAKEIYLKEEKARVQSEYDAKLKKIETDLEAVRAQKISF